METNERKLRVLIAEDEPFVSLGFKAMVKACGAEVIGTVDNGLDAVVKALELQPDILLMDINMPGMDGLTAIARINETQHIPAIIITGFKDNDLDEQIDQPYVYGYLHKPVDEGEIRNALRIAASRFTEHISMEQERDDALQALADRKLVERAKGILMQKFGLSEPDAMKALQNKSKNENKKLPVVARQIIQASKLL